jgi:hypothetical protein
MPASPTGVNPSVETNQSGRLLWSLLRTGSRRDWLHDAKLCRTSLARTCGF